MWRATSFTPVCTLLHPLGAWCDGESSPTIALIESVLFKGAIPMMGAINLVVAQQLETERLRTADRARTARAAIASVSVCG